MKITRNRAVGLALTTAVISGIAIFLSKIAVKVVADPVVFTFLKNVIVAGLLIGILAVSTRFGELKKLVKKDWYKLIAVGVVGGSLPFILFFTGLTKTTALNASIIHKTLFIWVALLALPFLKERMGALQGAALLLLVGGNFALGGLRNFTWGTGELMILAATLLWAVENIIAKKALRNLSSILVAGARMVFGSVIIFIVIAFQGNLSMLGGLSMAQWWWTILPAVFLLGYVTTWYTALKYAPASIVASLLVPATIVTNILSMIFLDKTLTVGELSSGILLSIAVGLIIIDSRKLSSKKKYAQRQYSQT